MVVVDIFPDKFNANGEVTAAMTQAITFSGTAIEVLNNNLNDPKVQSMVKHILGDGAVQQTNVDKIKGKRAPATRCFACAYQLLTKLINASHVWQRPKVRKTGEPRAHCELQQKYRPCT